MHIYKHISLMAFWLFFILIPVIQAYNRELTIHVDAGKKDCFFHHVEDGEQIEIDYQVIDGGHGDLDINFSILDPVGLVIVSDYKKSENLHRHDARHTGDYRFCFDNSISSYNRKTVFFEYAVDREGVENFGDNQWNDPFEGLSPEEYYEVKVKDIMQFITNIRTHLTKARQIQDIIRSHEARDRNLAETNFSKVNIWSFIQLLAMVVVGLLQVFMLRSIFETNSRITKFWRKYDLLRESR